LPVICIASSSGSSHGFLPPYCYLHTRHREPAA
jgi:hypothetical protein